MNDGRVEILSILLIEGKNNGLVFGNKRTNQSFNFHGKQLKRLGDFSTINRTFISHFVCKATFQLQYET